MYVKLFSSILTSSVWAEDSATRIVWITILALCDKDGHVRASPSGLARLANVTIGACSGALEKFRSPDPESGSKDFEGRRIEDVDGGWFVLNYAKYRAIQDEEDRKASWRESSRKYRQRQPASAKSAPRTRKSAQAEAEAKAEVGGRGGAPEGPPSLPTATTNPPTPLPEVDLVEVAKIRDDLARQFGKAST